MIVNLRHVHQMVTVLFKQLTMLLDLLESTETPSVFYCLMLQDIHMVAAGNVLKSLYPKQFHVTCVAHLLHNCAMKVKSHFHDVDQLIASIKAATVKIKSRHAQFADVGYPPQPIVTRWVSWLNAALCYARNLPEVKSIVESFEGSGVLVTQAKIACKHLV